MRLLRVSARVMLGLIIILLIRVYTLNFAIRAAHFGCESAAVKEYIDFSPEDGNKLYKFCIERKKMYTYEIGW